MSRTCSRGRAVASDRPATFVRRTSGMNACKRLRRETGMRRGSFLSASLPPLLRDGHFGVFLITRTRSPDERGASPITPAQPPLHSLCYIDRPCEVPRGCAMIEIQIVPSDIRRRVRYVFFDRRRVVVGLVALSFVLAALLGSMAA